MILKKLEIFSIVYFDNKKHFYINLMILELFSLFDFKVVVYSSGLLEEQEEFDNKVVDLFSYKTYEDLSTGTGHSYFGDVDYTLTYSTENIPHDFSSCGASKLIYYSTKRIECFIKLYYKMKENYTLNSNNL